ncbi:uncharacterized protein TrAtP1_006515 [Trichoderma atroviride]|uniref:uncharacterized protein n=1 Tax=Hypocrea atroviridis TaxID=63577 RepID=UPI0033264444|nr:hypothetical protein TrAtP1_006515 [Trichoderma atroviride]
MSPMACDSRESTEWREKCKQAKGSNPGPDDSSQACVVCQVSLFVRRGTLQRAYEERLHQQIAAESLSSERQTLVNANLQEEVLEPRLVGVLGGNRQLLRCSFATLSPGCPVQMVEHMMGAWFRQRQVPATREYPGFAA